jgi:hypothetical protein
MAATRRHHANDITGNSRRHCMMFYPSPKNPTFFKIKHNEKNFMYGSHGTQ